MGETLKGRLKEQYRLEALWITGKRGFFDHGAIDNYAIRTVIAILAPTHSQEEIFAIIQEGLQTKNLRTGIAFSWNDVAEAARNEYARYQQERGSSV